VANVSEPSSGFTIWKYEVHFFTTIGKLCMYFVWDRS
jgi:hypothetical protein